MLAFGTPDQVKARCKEIIDGVAGDGGYIMDASAIMQNDALPENVRAMTEFTREYGVYDAPMPRTDNLGGRSGHQPAEAMLAAIDPARSPKRKPGVAIPWEEKVAELPEIVGDKDLARQVWEDVDALAYTFLWQCLLSF
jgi:hypothetical protein